MIFPLEHFSLPKRAYLRKGMEANGGGDAPENQRADITQEVTEDYSAGATGAGRKRVLEKIQGIMGDGHDDGNKSQLIERLVTARLMQQAKEREVVEEEEGMVSLSDDPDTDDDVDVEKFTEVQGTKFANDFRQYQATSLYEIRKQLHGIKQEQKKQRGGGGPPPHTLRYMNTRRHCTICVLLNPAGEDEEQKPGKKTDLHCTTCHVAVCTASACLMAHIYHGKGSVVRSSTWADMTEKADQGGYRAVPSRAPPTADDEDQ